VESFRDTLVASAAELGNGPDAFRPLDDADAAGVAAAVERAFGDAANGAMVGWWHSDRPCPLPTAARCFREGGWRHLVAVALDPAAPVWLLAENWYGGRPVLFAFESTAAVVQAILGNSSGFEYIVCGRQLDWLFAEDHHDCVSVAGTGAVERLGRVIEAEPGAAADPGHGPRLL
jgi:hypothetical protein